jgi:hypothetical protein
MNYILKSERHLRKGNNSTLLLSNIEIKIFNKILGNEIHLVIKYIMHLNTMPSAVHLTMQHLFNLHKSINLCHGIITRVLHQRPNSRDSYMSSLATCPNLPNKEVSSGEWQTKEIYYGHGHSSARGKVSISTHL